jgi:hypothetical protein
VIICSRRAEINQHPLNKPVFPAFWLLNRVFGPYHRDWYDAGLPQYATPLSRKIISLMNARNIAHFGGVWRDSGYGRSLSGRDTRKKLTLPFDLKLDFLFAAATLVLDVKFCVRGDVEAFSGDLNGKRSPFARQSAKRRSFSTNCAVV